MWLKMRLFEIIKCSTKTIALLERGDSRTEITWRMDGLNHIGTCVIDNEQYTIRIVCFSLSFRHFANAYHIPLPPHLTKVYSAQFGYGHGEHASTEITNLGNSLVVISCVTNGIIDRLHEIGSVVDVLLLGVSYKDNSERHAARRKTLYKRIGLDIKREPGLNFNFITYVDDVAAHNIVLSKFPLDVADQQFIKAIADAKANR